MLWFLGWFGAVTGGLSWFGLWLHIFSRSPDR
jgi:hypothetical protein